MPIDYSKTCFVIMPFGPRKVDGMDVNFDEIYDNIFEPAIADVDLPEGGKLIPKRTDKEYFSANIDTEMFLYLQYSRFAFVDITGLNPNVFYELGIRHQTNQSGTAIFRQADKMIPFDINHIKAFPYEYQPVEAAEAAKKLIKDVLSASLLNNRLDSPVQVALAAQQLMSVSGDTEQLLKDAAIAMRNDDHPKAISKYKEAVTLDPTNPMLHQELGLLLKGQDKWSGAATNFEKATKLSPLYSEAWRELGIAQNKIFHKEKDPAKPDGETALLKAIDLNKDDFDAYASLGGIYKRQEKYDTAAEMYRISTDLSNGHPYPLLNGLVLQVREQGTASISGKQKQYMKRAEIALKKQVADTPPYNSPWCFFDLSTIYLLNNNADSLKILEDMPVVAQDWEYKTHYDTLKLIENREDELNYWEPVSQLLESYL